MKEKEEKEEEKEVVKNEIKKEEKKDVIDTKDITDKKVKIFLKINKFKYFPLEEIDGFIIIKSNKDLELNNSLDSPEVCFTLTQKMAHLCVSNCINVSKIDQQLYHYDNIKGSDISNGLQIPIKYKIPDITTPNFYPSFRYVSPDMKCVIIHTLTIEIPFFSNKAMFNLFIRKPPPKENNDKNKNNNNKDDLFKGIFGDEIIKKLFTKMGRLSYYIKVKKSLYYKDKLPVEINIDTGQLGNIIIESIILKIKKCIILYDYDGYTNNEEKLEKDFDLKKIIFKGNTIKNNSITETLQLSKEEFVPLSAKEICRPKISEGNNNFTPPLKCSLFECKYYLYVEFILLDKLMKNKIVEIPFDLSDNQDDIKDKDIKKEKNEEEDLDIGEINEIGIGSINEMNDEDNENENDEIFRDFERESVRKRNDNKIKNIKNNNNITINDNITNNNTNDNNINNNNKEYEGFVIFDDDDFMKSFKENKNKK